MPGSCELHILIGPWPRADARRLLAELLPRIVAAAGGADHVEVRIVPADGPGREGLEPDSSAGR
jgi:hypothetical protein